MATGYTQFILNGCSFKEFALRCARNFGALVHMREDPMDAEIPDEVDSGNEYYENQFRAAESDLKRVQNMTPEDAEAGAQRQYESRLEDYRECIERCREKQEKYNKMLEHVRAWKVPSEEHNGLRDFMIEQIEGSIDHDCDIAYWNRSMHGVRKMTGEEWLKDMTETAEKHLEYVRGKVEENRARNNSKAIWIRQLKESLEKFDD